MCFKLSIFFFVHLFWNKRKLMFIHCKNKQKIFLKNTLKNNILYRILVKITKNTTTAKNLHKILWPVLSSIQEGITGLQFRGRAAFDSIAFSCLIKSELLHTWLVLIQRSINGFLLRIVTSDCFQPILKSLCVSAIKSHLSCTFPELLLSLSFF